jgi:hypothetical protein
MEIAGRYLKGSLTAIEPLPKTPVVQPVFGNFARLTAPRPNRPPEPLVFMYPGQKGPGFI